MLELRGVSKHFPGVQALNNVNLTLRRGTVHALVGENGAGKSTLMKCLLGIYQKDAGDIYVNGERIENITVKRMRGLGLSIIQQELSPVPERNVMENIWLGHEPKTGVFVDHRKMKQDTKELLEKLNLPIDPLAKMSSLTVAKMQMVEIAKAVSWGAKIIMMDEPTSALTNQEVDYLFDIIADLKKQGVGIIYVTHKMDEIMRITDDVTVLRDGQWIASHSTKDVTIDQLISEMVGREISEDAIIREHELGPVVLSVKGIQADKAFADVSFDLHEGEILGIAGLVGAGRTEVLEALFGLRRITEGTVEIFGEESKISSPRQAIKHKMAFLTEERRKDGIMAVLSVGENALITNYRDFINPLRLINGRKARRAVDGYIEKLGIKTQGFSEIIQNLSGGNQQKVLLARWLMSDPKILMLDEPTRGIDVGAKSEIHNLICGMAKEGKSIIVVSSEMPELLKICDRIVTMKEGKMTGIIDREEATQEKIMMMCSLPSESVKEVSQA